MSSIEKEIRLKINDNDIERIKKVTDSYKERTRLIDITCGKYEFDSLSKLGYIGRIRCNGNSYKIEIKNYQNKDECLEKSLPINSIRDGLDFFKLLNMEPYLVLDRYREEGVKLIPIENHNNIEELRKNPNSEFANMKQNIIIGVRKTHKFVPNHKVSDFLVPYTSSGCIAMCMYCYLVCNYNKCSYLRIFVNREEMLDKIIKVANQSDKELTFEIGSNSDLILENTITHNLEWTIENFNADKGYLTFPTKFDMVDPLLNLRNKEKIIIRMSMNPEEIINRVEFGTSRLEERIKAINKLKEAGYKVGILIAPIILVDNWEELYEELIKKLSEELSEEIKNDAVFELIFMTYSYVHKMINKEAFPNAINLFNPEIMTGRGRGKYMYKKETREKGEEFLRKTMKKYLPNSEILYIV